MTDKELGTQAGTGFTLSQNQLANKSTTVFDTVNFPPGTPASQASNATGNIKVTWRVS